MAKKKANYEDKYIGKLLGASNKLSDKISGGLSDAGLQFLANYVQKQKDRSTRVFNKTGQDDPMLLNMAKDNFLSRPARDAAVGMGIGLGKLSGADTSNWLDAGDQGNGMIGDWSFLLDDEERQALQDNPGKQAMKDVANVGGAYMSAGANTLLGPAMSQIPSKVGRVLARGTAMLPGNLSQAYGQTEEYRGENPIASMLGAGAMSYAGPAAQEVLGSLGKPKNLDKLRRDAFKSVDVSEADLNKGLSKSGTNKYLNDIELLQRADKTDAAKNYLIALRDGGLVDPDQINMSLEYDYGILPGEGSQLTKGDKKIRAGKRLERSTIGMKTPVEPGGQPKAAKYVADAEEVINKWVGPKKGVNKLTPTLSEYTIGDADTAINNKLSKEINANIGKTVKLQDVVDEATNEMAGPLGMSTDEAKGMITASLNDAMRKLNINATNGTINTSQLADMKRFLQPDAAKVLEKTVVPQSVTNNAAIHNSVYGKLQNILGKEGSSLYDDLNKLWKVKNVIKYSDTALGNSNIAGMKLPFLQKLVSGAGTVAAKGLKNTGQLQNALGGVKQTVGSAATNFMNQIPQGVSQQVGNQLGRMAGNAVFGGQSPDITQTPDTGMGTNAGIGTEPGMGTDGTQELMDNGFDNMDFMNLLNPQQEQEPQQQFDTQAMTMDLMSAVAAGQLSASDAKYIVEMVNQMNGGQDIKSQIAQVAQTDPEQAQQLLGQALLSGEIDSATANSVADMFGLGASSGKTLPSSALKSLSEITEALNLLPDLTNLTEDSISAFGPIEGRIRGVNPWDQGGQNAKATIKLIKQIIGKGLEGGVLRKEDEAKYEDILPNLNDTEATVANKIENLKRTLGSKYNTLIETYSAGGYDPFSGGLADDYSSLLK